MPLMQERCGTEGTACDQVLHALHSPLHVAVYRLQLPHHCGEGIERRVDAHRNVVKGA